LGVEAIFRFLGSGVDDFFSISMRAPDPSSRPSGPFLPFWLRESAPDPRNRILASTPDAICSDTNRKITASFYMAREAGIISITK